MSSNEDVIELGEDIGSIPRQDQAEVVPASTYLVEIVGVTKLEPDPKKDKGGQLFVRYKIEDVANPDYTKYKNAVFVDTLSLKSQSLWKLALISDAIEGKKVEGTSIKYKSWIGKKLVVRTSLEDWQGSQQTRCQTFAHTSAWRGTMPSGAQSAPSTSKKPSGDDVEI